MNINICVTKTNDSPYFVKTAILTQKSALRVGEIISW